MPCNSCLRTPATIQATTPDPESAYPPTSPVESVDRALRVLQALAIAGPDGRSLGSLANSLGVNKTTLHRILGVLRFRDFVFQDPRSGNYSLGPAVLGIGEGFFSDENMPALLHPALVALSTDVGELVHLGSLSGAYVAYLDKVEPERSIRVWSSIGQRMPAVTAMGRALLSAQGTDRTLLTSYLKAVGRRSDVDPDQVWLFAEYFGDRSAARTTLQANLPGFDIEVVAILYSPSTGE